MVGFFKAIDAVLGLAMARYTGNRVTFTPLAAIALQADRNSARRKFRN